MIDNHDPGRGAPCCGEGMQRGKTKQNVRVVLANETDCLQRVQAILHSIPSATKKEWFFTLISQTGPTKAKEDLLSHRHSLTVNFLLGLGSPVLTPFPQTFCVSFENRPTLEGGDGRRRKIL